MHCVHLINILMGSRKNRSGIFYSHQKIHKPVKVEYTYYELV